VCTELYKLVQVRWCAYGPFMWCFYILLALLTVLLQYLRAYRLTHLSQGAPITAYKCFFANLAICLFAPGAGLLRRAVMCVTAHVSWGLPAQGSRSRAHARP
jgi:hypothetical protein